MRHIISILLENEAGALSRVCGLFSARGYNIESLAVGPTERPELSRITLQVGVDSEQVLEQITKQLNKLVEVLKIVELEESAVRRELVLIKLKADPAMDALITKVRAPYEARLAEKLAVTDGLLYRRGNFNGGTQAAALLVLRLGPYPRLPGADGATRSP